MHVVERAIELRRRDRQGGPHRSTRSASKRIPSCRASHLLRGQPPLGHAQRRGYIGSMLPTPLGGGRRGVGRGLPKVVAHPSSPTLRAHCRATATRWDRSFPGRPWWSVFSLFSWNNTFIACS